MKQKQDMESQRTEGAEDANEPSAAELKAKIKSLEHINSLLEKKADLSVQNFT